MPVNDKSYENGKIYRIWSLDTDKIYIGSTADTLSHRFSKHKSDYKCWKKNGKGTYISSYSLFDLVGVDNCKIELEHNFACDNKTELNKEEGRIQRLHKDIIINKDIAGRTLKEYYQDNKEEIKEKAKEYRQEHKEKIKEQKKEYHQDHKEKINEYSKEYRQQHKEELNQKANQKHTCECGGKYTQHNKQQHFKSKKHLNYINHIQGLQTQTQNS